MGKLNLKGEFQNQKGEFLLYLILMHFPKKNSFENSSKNDLSFGGDLKIPVGSGLNIDLTINPDFSQVEVDNEIINPSMFEIRMPEKDKFFLQNKDIFQILEQLEQQIPFLPEELVYLEILKENIIQNKILVVLD